MPRYHGDLALEKDDELGITVFSLIIRSNTEGILIVAT